MDSNIINNINYQKYQNNLLLSHFHILRTDYSLFMYDFDIKIMQNIWDSDLISPQKG